MENHQFQWVNPLFRLGHFQELWLLGIPGVSPWLFPRDFTSATWPSRLWWTQRCPSDPGWCRRPPSWSRMEPRWSWVRCQYPYTKKCESYWIFHIYIYICCIYIIYIYISLYNNTDYHHNLVNIYIYAYQIESYIGYETLLVIIHE